VESLALDGRNRLWATEFGEKEADELNLTSRGRNYGWPSATDLCPGLRAPLA
jgi:glucose/arabinose dehydrogenase